MYHFELRKFPHTASRFNQSERQVLALVVPWVREQWVELGERKWNVNETKLTVLEGPELSLQDMAMNRGWRNAQRKSDDVTERVLAAARGAGAGGSAPAPGGVAPAPARPGAPVVAQPAAGLLADSLALELLGLLDAGPAPLPRAWRIAHERLGARPASESLALAERAVRSLLDRGLVALQAGGVDDRGGESGEIAADRIDAMLGAVESWTAAEHDSLAIARKG